MLTIPLVETRLQKYFETNVTPTTYLKKMVYQLASLFYGPILIRVAIIGTIFFIAIIDNFFKIIAIISVIGDKFGKIIQVIFVCNLHT